MKQRLRVLFLPAWYPSEDEPVRGTFVREHARAASIYNDITVLYAYGDSVPSLKLFRIGEEKYHGIRTITIRYGGFLSWFWRRLRLNEQRSQASWNVLSKKSITNILKLLETPKTVISDLLFYAALFLGFHKLLIEGYRPDIIHAHVFTAGVPAVLLGKLYKMPVVITEHWSIFPLHSLGWLDRVKARFAMNKAAVLISVSNALKEAIEYYGIRNDSQLVPNVADIKTFYPSNFQDERVNSIKEILIVAALRPIKGIPYLLEALSKIKSRRNDFLLEVVGDGVCRKEYEQLAKDLGLHEEVTFHGLKGKDQVAEFVRHCDFFVLPSIWDNMPTVLAEALASGKPVVGSDIGGIREVISRDVGILVPPKDIDGLGQAIEFMLDNYADYSQRKIVEYAKDKFSYEAVGQLLDKVYRNIKGAR
ncbi:MAG: glycosyltransferase [Chloroflexota bacterium]